MDGIRAAGLIVGLAGGVGVAARPNNDANGFDRREGAGAMWAGVLAADKEELRAPGRGGKGGLVGKELAEGRGGKGSAGF